LQHRPRIGLIGAAVTEYPHLQEVCAAITAQGGQVSVSSLRLSTLTRDQFLIPTLLAAGQKTISVAPEAGTERLRKVVRKALPDAALFEALAYLATTSVSQIKFYFLIGLPTETDDDLEAIVNFCKKSLHLFVKTGKHKGKSGKFTLSINPFVPKPFTPFQWCAMDGETELKRKIQRIQRGVSRFRNVEVIYELPKWAIWQGILARGDRRLGHILVLTHQYQGDWKKAFREFNRHPDFYVHRVRQPSEIFPWAHIAIGETQQALYEDYQRIVGSVSF
jgi:radical SAM superfamily enzyme YgiQ (UPF0313 family)